MGEFGEAEAMAAAEWVAGEIERRIAGEGGKYEGFPTWPLHREGLVRRLADCLLSLDRRGVHVAVPVIPLGFVSFRLAPGLASVTIEGHSTAGGEPVQVYPAAAGPKPETWRDRPPLL